MAGFPVTAGDWLSADTWPRVGTSSDMAEVAGRMLEPIVPEFADAAGVLVRERLLVSGEPGGPAGGAMVLRRLGTRLAGDAQRADAAFPAGEVVAFAAESPYARCVSSGNPVTFARPDGPTLKRLRHEGRDIISRYGAFLAVPMIARGTAVGLFAFARTPDRPGFTETDIGVAGQLAGRAAAYLTGAGLASPGGLEIAGRCLPADGPIGGDWYDIIPGAAGKTTLIVGDVMGHGVEAAATMAQLRAAARTLAGLQIPPAEMLARLDRTTVTFHNADYATCVCAVIDAAARHATIALAGHLPPVIAMADGTTHVPDIHAGMPLGLGVGPFTQVRVRLPAGAILALFTDGLVETRTRPYDQGLLTMRGLLARQHGDLEHACDALVAGLDENGEDDITLVLARIPL
jgi:Stage II sporulation protein E (SpoIIE)/GAF domain